MPKQQETEAVQAAIDRHRDDTRMAELVVGEELSLVTLAQEQQTDKERRIAECHQAIGRMQAAKVFSQFADVSNLVWLKDVKESKIYKDLPGVGTWAKLCESLDISPQQADENLRNLAAFGEKFLLTVSNLRVGYRELPQLPVADAGALTIDAAGVTIAGECIPLGPEYGQELQAAIEDLLNSKESEIAAQKKLVEQKQTVIDKRDAEITVLEGKIEEGAETLAQVKAHRSPDEAEFFRRLESWRLGFEAFLHQFEPGETPLMANATPRMEAALVEVMGYFHRQITIWHDCTIEHYGDRRVDDLGWVAPDQRGPQLVAAE